MVKICSDSDFKKYIIQGLKHVTPRGGGFDFRHVVKVRINLHSHMDLNSNCNVGNVYTDIKVYNKPSFCSKLIGNVIILIHLCWKILTYLN
jgi:hypothetical protein